MNPTANSANTAARSWRPISGQGRGGVALVVVLSFVVLLTVVVVAYFSRVLSTRQEANDSFNGGRTDQLARSAMDVIVNDFKQEIANGSTADAPAMPSPAPANVDPTYFPVKSDGTVVRANMVPQRFGTTDALPNLIRRSVASDSVAPTPPPPGLPSRASAVNSYSNPSANGRRVTPLRWNKPALLPRQNPGVASADLTPVGDFVAPDWVMMTQEEGPAVLGSPTTDKSGKTVTPIGRYAYTVYDEGGLLDANVVGFPSGTPLAPQRGYKPAPGYADLAAAFAGVSPTIAFTQTGAVDPLVGWRNFAVTQPSGTFPGSGFASNFASDPTVAARYAAAVQANTDGFLHAGTGVWSGHPGGDQLFLSRQQLLGFRNAAGFPVDALQSLGTFSRELNAPGWGPTRNAAEMDPGGKATDTNGVSAVYKDNRNSATAYNRLLPGVRFSNSGTITSYRVDGTPYTYAVNAGMPLVQRRFPLDRLAWVGPNGPRADKGGTAAGIQACFGLVWGPCTDTNVTAASGGVAVNVWKYVGPTGTAEQSLVKTLGDVAAEAQPREPNFFELLQAGMLSGSLAMNGNPSGSGFSFATSYEGWRELHVLRIGASIITQAQQADSTFPQVYPTAIEYSRNGLPELAVATDDLPYVNSIGFVGGQGTTSAANIACYLLFSLWNPHQHFGTTARPPVRLCTTGYVTLANRYGDTDPAKSTYMGTVSVYNWTPPTPGYVCNIGSENGDKVARLPLRNDLASVGVNGFVDPRPPMGTDMLSAPTIGGPGGKSWATLPSIHDSATHSTAYLGYRLPDFIIDPNRAADPPVTGDTNNALWPWIQFAVAPASMPRFNVWMEFQTPSGGWIPYNYYAGIDHATDWYATGYTPFVYGTYIGRTYPVGYTSGPGNKAAPMPVDPPSGLADTFYYLHYPWITTDPRPLRFNYTQAQTPTTYLEWPLYLTATLLSSATETSYPADKGTGRVATKNAPSALGGPTFGYAPFGLTRNNYSVTPTGVTAYASYADPDGVPRIADSGLYTVDPHSSWQGDPYALSTSTTPGAARVADRPIVLHRPFANVAELGYVARDYPWKTLDFFSAHTADGALLDLFTVSRNTGPLAAGRLNLNTRNAAALLALTSGSIADVLPATPTTLSKPLRLATRLAAFTASTDPAKGPLVSKDDLVARFVSTLSTTFPVSSTSDAAYTAATSSDADFTSSDEELVKPRREAVTRAFAEIGQTRTWNLLIDVIAQSGRYAPGATSLAGFNVEGERRYWLHVAIDRFTGEVIDEQFEPVNE